MKVKKEKLFSIYSVIESFNGQEVKPKFAYFLAKNKRKIEPEIRLLEGVNPMMKKDFQDERKDFLLSFAKKDKKKGIMWKVKGQMPEYEKGVNISAELGNFISKKYEDKKFADSMKEYEDLLAGEIEINFFQTSIDNFPEASSSVVEVLFDMIKEE